MDDRKTIELIDRYLNDELNPEQRAAVEQRLANDTEFRAEVELHRQLNGALADQEQGQLFVLLQEIDRKVVLPPAGVPRAILQRRCLYFLAFVLLLIVAVVVGWPRQQPAASTPDPSVQPPAPAPATPEMPVAEQSRPEVAPAPASPPRARSSQRRLAAADPAAFRPNTVLEPLAGTGFRGAAAIDVSITEPPNGAALKRRDGRVQLRVAGTMNADLPPAEGAYEMAIFNNREDDFLAGRAVHRVPIRIGTAVEGAYPIEYEGVLPLTPGVYYLLVTATGDTEPLTVVKVVVQQ